MYGTRDSNTNGVYNPKSVSQDFVEVDQHYLSNMKATTGSDLKKNYKRGIKTHFTFHNRPHNGFAPMQTASKNPKVAIKAEKHQAQKLKDDISKEHFSLGKAKSDYSTTNKELMKSSSMPNLEDSTKYNSKIKKMMRNHHFDFGKNKPEFSSTFNSNFVEHKIDRSESVSQAKKYAQSKSKSSVPLQNALFNGDLKIKTTLKPNSDAFKSMKYYIPTTTRRVKEKSNFTIGAKKSLVDNYQTSTSSMGNLPELAHANFINSLSESKEKTLKFRKTNFNLGSPTERGFPNTLNQDTFKEHHKESYRIKGIYKQGFKAKNKKNNLSLKHH
mmetsp:Transcript_17116/g.15080  ORF Transcript_17116/g.15080 Transcript_17116/m.15080 type:complete len:328 (-) Transcript_17116:26-1009(-)